MVLNGGGEPNEVSYTLSRGEINNKQKFEELMTSTNKLDGNFYIAVVLNKSWKNILR